MGCDIHVCLALKDHNKPVVTLPVKYGKLLNRNYSVFSTLSNVRGMSLVPYTPVLIFGVPKWFDVIKHPTGGLMTKCGHYMGDHGFGHKRVDQMISKIGTIKKNYKIARHDHIEYLHFLNALYDTIDQQNLSFTDERTLYVIVGYDS